MLSVNSADSMLHPFECSALLDLPWPECVAADYPGFPDALLGDESPDYDTPLDHSWLPSCFIDSDEDSLDDSLLRLVDPSQISNETSADEDSRAVPYHPYYDHSYIKIESADQPHQHDVQLHQHEDRPEDELYLSDLDDDDEDKVDIWTRHEPLPEQPEHPKDLSPRKRRCKANPIKTVSIRRAATTVLKRTRSQAYGSRKVRKIENSVETTPSGSTRGSDYDEYEDVVTTRNRGAKFTAIRAISINANNSINSSSKTSGKSEVQRTNHNRNEKKRREQMGELMKRVLDLTPVEFFKENKTEKAKLKASKQKILTACRLYINEVVTPMVKENDRLEKLAKHQRFLRSKKRQLLSRLQTRVNRMRQNIPYGYE